MQPPLLLHWIQTISELLYNSWYGQAKAAIGMACGAGLYLLAAIAALLIWFVLSIVGRLEKLVSPVKTNNRGYRDDGQNDGGEAHGKPTADKVTGFRSID